jgi:hypothetical protein
MSRITGGLKEYKILFLIQLELSILYNLSPSPWCLTHRGLRPPQTLRHL